MVLFSARELSFDGLVSWDPSLDSVVPVLRFHTASKFSVDLIFKVFWVSSIPFYSDGSKHHD
jgi:hypothetical protein